MHVPEPMPEPRLKTDAIDQHRADHCRNCGAAVNANYCPHCGQETVLHMPSAGEFLHEFVSHYVALEGKLWKSLGLLLFKPGRLTREYLDGRRARYVLPLRLYLTFSIIFFALFKLGLHDAETVPRDAGADRPAAVARQEPAQAASADERKNVSLIHFDSQTHEVSGRLVEMAPRAVQEKLARFKGMSGEEIERQFRTAFFSYVPYAVFALMPLFALYLKLLYLGSGRRYGEHLLFALHTNAFAFLMLSVMLVIPQGVPLVSGLLGLWLVFYLPTAMRKVYGGGRLATFARWSVLALLHVFTVTLGIFVAVGIGVALSA